MGKRPKKLLDQVRDALRAQHYSIHTEKTYVRWIKRYILFHGKRHPKKMGVPEIEAFLIHLAVDQNMAASTQTQALSALLFLYREVLEKELGGPIDQIRVRRPGQRVPTVLTREEVRLLLSALPGTDQTQLIVKLLYGSGLRLIECLRLRIIDLDFDHRQIAVRARKGPVTTSPCSPIASLSLSGNTCSASKQFTNKTSQMAMAPSIYLLLSRKRTLEIGAGNTSSRPAISPQIPDPASRAAIIWARAARRKQSEKRSKQSVSTNLPVAAPCAIALLLTCWMTGTTSELCKSCSVTRT